MIGPVVRWEISAPIKNNSHVKICRVYSNCTDSTINLPIDPSLLYVTDDESDSDHDVTGKWRKKCIPMYCIDVYPP